MSPFFKQSTNMYELLTPRLEIGPKVGKLEEVNEKIQPYIMENRMCNTGVIIMSDDLSYIQTTEEALLLPDGENTL
jgi:hypothetical protein